MPDPRPRQRPSLVIRDPALRPRHRRIALLTVCGPLLGTLAAFALLPVTGFGMLELGLLVGGFVLTNLGIEFGYHRNLAHKAFETRPGIRYAFAVLGSMAGEGRVLHWVADHRRHHACSDTPDDPHSPHVRSDDGEPRRLGVWEGLWHAQIGHMLVGDVTNCTLYARDINLDPMLRGISERYVAIVAIGLALPAAIGAAVTGTWLGALSGLLWGGLVRMFLVHHTTWAVASIAHRFGSSPFITGDHSVNNLPLGVLSFGSAYQNNHHAFPSSAYLGLRWWEVDVAGLLVRTLAAVGLVWNVKQPAARDLDAKRAGAAGPEHSTA
jgi:stearoyl-CoA desaturase (delta-9 desaturase)